MCSTWHRIVYAGSWQFIRSYDGYKCARADDLWQVTVLFDQKVITNSDRRQGFWPSSLTSRYPTTVDDYPIKLAVSCTSCPPAMPCARPYYLLRLGFIDFLVHWCALKRTESALKRTCLHPRHSERVTIMDPDSYARRQLEYLTAVFAPSSP